MHAKYEVCNSYCSKVIANVKVDNRQTNWQDKNNMLPIIRSRGMKSWALVEYADWAKLSTKKLSLSWVYRWSKVKFQKVEHLLSIQMVQSRVPKRSALVEYSDGAKKIVAAFWGMHVSPAKHSFGKWDRQTDGGQSYPYVSLCFAGDTKTTKSWALLEYADWAKLRTKRLSITCSWVWKLQLSEKLSTS